MNVHVTPPAGWDPDHPLTGGFVEDWSAATNDTAVAALERYNAIYIHVPWHAEFHSRCDFMIKLGQTTKGSPQKGLRVLAPSGSGKSTAAQHFINFSSSEVHALTTMCR